MEADWEFELGSDSPLIDAAWPGFVDLRLHPQRVNLITEARQLPGLADALLSLNAPLAPVWTSKCDVWRVEQFDPHELDAPPELAATVVACYIDLLPGSNQQWGSPRLAEQTCRALCGRLHAVSLPCCRADLVIRRVAPDEFTLGITAYLVACGPTEDSAKEQLANALAAFVDSIGSLQSRSASFHRYNEKRGE